MLSVSNAPPFFLLDPQIFRRSTKKTTKLFLLESSLKTICSAYDIRCLLEHDELTLEVQLALELMSLEARIKELFFAATRHSRAKAALLARVIARHSNERNHNIDFPWPTLVKHSSDSLPDTSSSARSGTTSNPGC